MADDWCFSKENLFDLGVTASKWNLLNTNTLLKFETLIEDLAILREEKVNFEKIMGEIPEEFCCELTCELLKNPVKLPTSQKIVSFNAI